jgi:hypothetical protein
MDTKKIDKLNKVVRDADKILSEARKEGVQTPTQFAEVFEKNPPSTLTSGEVKTQVTAMKDFSDGKISYSQMRSMCG